MAWIGQHVSFVNRVDEVIHTRIDTDHLHVGFRKARHVSDLVDRKQAATWSVFGKARRLLDHFLERQPYRYAIGAKAVSKLISLWRRHGQVDQSTEEAVFFAALQLTLSMTYKFSFFCQLLSELGARCKNWQCNGSKLIGTLPAKLRRKLEHKMYEVAGVQRCNGDPEDCCALCSVHMILVFAQVMSKESAVALFKQVNGIEGGDWKSHAYVWGKVGQTLHEL